MHESFIQFNLRSEDEDGSLHIGIESSNSIYSSYEECYLWPETLREFGEQLMSFPKSKEQEVVFRYGEESDECFSFISIKIFVYNANGHSALEVRMNSNKTNELKRVSNYCIQCEVAALNQFGKKLIEWDPIKEKVFRFEFSRAG